MCEAKKILVVVDVQNDFITGALSNEEAVKKVPNIVKKIRNFNGDCICVTLDTHSTDYLDTKEGNKLPVPHCQYATEGWELEPNVKAALEDAKLRNILVFSFQKPTFGSLELIEQMAFSYGKEYGHLEECDIEIVGFCTDICVVSNAMLIKTAFYEQAEITVDASCCAGVTKETHKAALETMKMCQINVINEDEE